MPVSMNRALTVTQRVGPNVRFTLLSGFNIGSGDNHIYRKDMIAIYMSWNTPINHMQ